MHARTNAERGTPAQDAVPTRCAYFFTRVRQRTSRLRFSIKRARAAHRVPNRPPPHAGELQTHMYLCTHGQREPGGPTERLCTLGRACRISKRQIQTRATCVYTCACPAARGEAAAAGCCCSKISFGPTRHARARAAPFPSSFLYNDLSCAACAPRAAAGF